MTAVCPKCGQEFILKKESAFDSAIDGISVDDPAFTEDGLFGITITCPHCKYVEEIK